MPTDFHIANIAPDSSVETLKNIFSEFGEVKQINILMDKHGNPRQVAHVVLELNSPEMRQALLAKMTGYMLGDRRLYATTTKPGKKIPLTPEDEEKIVQIAEYLGEKDTQPLSQLRRLVQFCGFDVVRQLLEEAEHVEANGGVLIGDRSRRRTFGGVFFHVTRHRISPHMQRVVFIPPATPEQQAAKKAAQAKPSANQGKGQAQDKSQPKVAGAKGGKKPEKQHPKQPQKPTKELPPKKLIKPAPVASDPVALANAQAEMAALRQAYANAQQQLESLKTLPPAERKSGLFSATREVVNVQKQMTALIKQFPELGDL